MRSGALALLFLVLFPLQARSGEIIAGVASVIDGDTIEIHGERIRLFGIDAPESGQRCIRDGFAYPCGRDAAFALADKIGRGVVTCVRRDTDRYGRMVAVCLKSAIDLGGWLVEHGHAIAFRKYSKLYEPHEDRARAANRGLWAADFENPRRLPATWPVKAQERLDDEAGLLVPG